MSDDLSIRRRPRAVRLGLVAAGLALLVALAAIVGSGGRAEPVTVFAASSLQNALSEAGAAYEKKTGRAVRLSFGASSALARQIEQGAPADLFVSADEVWMDWLAERSLIAPQSRADLLANRLALIAPADSTVELAVAAGMPIAEALGPDGRLAVAAAEVPAGRYARAALEALGVLDDVEDRFAPGENVRTALNFVARGETPLGVVYDTDAKVEPRVRIVGLFPEGSHPRIVYPAARIAGSRNRDAAALLDWLKGPEAAAIFAANGFSRPG